MAVLIKPVFLALAFCLIAGLANAESIEVNRDPVTGRFTLTESPTAAVKDAFTYTYGKILDWAIASSVEPVFYHDLLKNESAPGGQVPLLYVYDIVTGDLGYLLSRSGGGSLAVGASLRLNRVIAIYFPDKVEFVKSVLPKRELIWDRLFLGPFFAYSLNGSRIMVGVKAGLEF